MPKRTKDLLLLSGVVCAAAVSIFLGLAKRPPKINLGTYEALGAVTAEETAKLLAGKGRVLVLARDTGPDKNPSVEAQLDVFKRTLRKHADISLVIERFTATPMLMMATGGSVPPDQLIKALETHADANVLVLFCGMPPLTDAELETIQRRRLKTVVVASLRPDSAQLLEQSIIHLLIAPRPDGPLPDAKKPQTLRELFDQDYVVIRAANLLRER